MDFHSILARGLDQNGIDPDNINTSSTDELYIAMSQRYCKIDTCPIEWGKVTYRPNMAANVIYMLAFSMLLSGQLWYGIRKKTWTFMGTVCTGLLLELIGYVGRIMLNKNPFNMDNFLINMIPLTIAPALLTAGIYLCLGRVIVAIGSENSRLKPKMYTYVFVGFDLLSLVLQAIGGGMAATAKDHKGSQQGTNIMIGGMICQVVSMALFFAVWCDFILRTRRAKLSGSLQRTQPPLYASLRSTRKFKLFRWSLFIATVLIFVRCIYRVAELWDGFSSKLANDEATFMVFEGPMIIIAMAGITIFHPGRVFDHLWVPAGQGVRSSNSKLGQSSSSTDLTDTEEWKNTAYQRV